MSRVTLLYCICVVGTFKYSSEVIQSMKKELKSHCVVLKT